MQKIKILFTSMVLMSSVFIQTFSKEKEIVEKENIKIENSNLQLFLLSSNVIIADSFLENKNTEIITKDEIKNSGAKNISEIFKNTTGISVKNFTNAEPTFDIRGQSETAKSNVIVLLNGVPLNSIDGSGYSTSNISIEQIERVEITKTGGAILYGDGAVAGTINFVTKPPQNKKNYGSISIDGSSYGSTKANVNVGTKLGNNLLIRTSYTGNNSNSARDYTWNNQRIFDTDAKLLFNKSSLFFKYIYSDQNYQLPGALTEKEVQENWKQAIARGDGKNESNLFYGNYTAKLNNKFDFAIYSSYSNKNMPAKYFSDYYTSYFTTKSDDFYIKPQIKYNYYKNDDLLFGWDYRNATSDVTEGFSLGKRTKISNGIFAMNKNNFGNFEISEGVRGQNIKINYVTDTTKIYHTSYDFGLNYFLPKSGTIFFNYANSFRTPTTDELAYWVGEINPETSDTFEIGVKNNFDKTIYSVTLFEILKKNEIVFADYNGQSYNYNLSGNTKRTGLELALEHNLYPLTLRESFTYIDSEITSGQFENSEMPLVSNKKIALGATYNLKNNLKLNSDLNYYSSSYSSTDFANKHGKSNAYTIVNSNIIYDYSQVLSFSFGVNNIFDKSYYNFVGWNDWTQDKYYYPANERNYFVGAKYVF